MTQVHYEFEKGLFTTAVDDFATSKEDLNGLDSLLNALRRSRPYTANYLLVDVYPEINDHFQALGKAVELAVALTPVDPQE